MRNIRTFAILAACALPATVEALSLDRVLFVPANNPPHKRGEALTPAAVRVEMLRAAIGDDARFEVCELELGRRGPSYTVDTLRARRPGRLGTGL